MASSDHKALYPRLLIIAGVILGAAVLGLVLGTLSVPAPEPSTVPPVANAPQVPAPPPKEDYVRPDAAPLYFHSGSGAGDGWRNTLAEMALAAQAGIHQHIFPAAFPWTGDGSTIGQQLDDAALADPMGAWLIELDLNPPDAWLGDNPAGIVTGSGGTELAAPSYADWRTLVVDGLDRLFAEVDRADYGERIAGVLLRGMAGGAWRYPIQAAPAAGEIDAYREWLAGVYRSDAALQQAWKDDAIGIGDAEPAVAFEGGTAILLSGQTTQRVADFRRFRAESIADALAAFAAHLKTARGPELQVLVAYGQSFDATPDAGHSALGLLLGTDVDGFVTPVSEADRGSGGAGGFAGPVDSAGHYGKTWLVIDNLRTGITRDPRTGAVERIRGLRAEDIYNVQRRNFGGVLVHGLGIAWSDPEGQGWLHDEAQWDNFGTMAETYREAAEQPEGEAAAISGADAIAPVGLMVVVDEAATRYADNVPAYLAQIQAARDAAMRSGVDTRFVLLQDVLDEITPPAESYLFINAVVLDAEDRERLHARLARENACAIWYYAPGFRADGGYATDNVAATVRMQVDRFDEAAMAGSVYALSGGWLAPEENLGAAIEYDPLFFIDDESVDVLARYREGGRASIATRYIEEENWTTVFIAEPGIGPGLLREILNVNEQLGYFRPTAPVFFDTAHIGGGYFVIHGKNVGERAVQLGGVYNVRDCFNEAAGWPERDGFLLPMYSGETRVLQLESIAAQE